MSRIIPILGNLDDIAEAIAEPPTRRPFERAVGEFGRTVCDRVAASPSSTNGTIIPLVSDLCGPYWEEQGTSPPEREAPLLTGGQCPVLYRVFPTLTGCGGANLGESLAGTFLGPFTYEIDAVSSPCSTPGEVFRPPQRLRTGDGQAILETGNACCVSARAYSFRFERVDGQPDDCGQQEGNFIPGPVPPPDPGPLPPGTGFDVGPDGEPVLIVPPSLDFSPSLESAIDVGDVTFGGGGGEPVALDSVPMPDAEVEGAGGGGGGQDDLFGPPPDGERWIGACVKIVQTPDGVRPIPGSTPEDVYPTVVGNARLIFGDGLSRGVDTSERVLGKNTCLWEPVRGLRPIGVFVDLLPGYSYTRTAYSVPVD